MSPKRILVWGHAKEPGHITDQNSSAAELGIKQGEERFRSLFENSSDAVLLSIPDGTIEAANPAACRLFGRSIEEICGSAGFGLADPSDSRLESLLEERERTGRFRGELFYKRKGWLDISRRSIERLLSRSFGQDQSRRYHS